MKQEKPKAIHLRCKRCLKEFVAYDPSDVWAMAKTCPQCLYAGKSATKF